MSNRATANSISLSALGGGEGRGEVGESRTVAEAHLTLPLRGPLPLPPCEGRRHGGQVFGDMVDGLTPAQLVPVVHRRDPRTAQRPPRVWRSGAWEVPVDPPGRG